MNAIHSTVRNGRITIDAPSDWPEGCAIIVEPVVTRCEKIGIDESEWVDDAVALADWDAWIKTIEPLELTPEERAAQERFNEEMRRHNIEAVRRQMEEGPLP